ncbi:MAG: acetylornithine deacetylase [Stellaceae bacterium]
MIDAAVAILERLVAFDTVSAKSNLGLIDWVADYLDGHGIASSLTRNPAATKANLFATIGRDDRGGIILSGHTDVVPVEGQDWQSDPFRLDLREDRCYGRGTADMKGFLALCLALVPQAVARPLEIPLHLALSYDEEVGCLGVPALIASLPEGIARPRLAIIGEPSEMRVANAHKGIHFLRTRVIGHDGHSSHPERGVNAIAAAAEIITEIGRLAAECRAAAGAGSRFDPPYTSFNIGRIAGGAAVNIIARDCTFDWEFRPVPGADGAALQRRIEEFVARDLLPRLRAGHPDASVETKAMALVPPLVPDPASPAEALAHELTGANAATTTAFATEAGLYQAAGIPAVICGPGSIAVAHQPDEFITRAELAAGAAFLDRLLARSQRGTS